MQGPRYCPSIEDKIVRFRDKDSHQVRGPFTMSKIPWVAHALAMQYVMRGVHMSRRPASRHGSGLDASTYLASLRP